MHFDDDSDYNDEESAENMVEEKDYDLIHKENKCQFCNGTLRSALKYFQNTKLQNKLIKQIPTL